MHIHGCYKDKKRMYRADLATNPVCFPVHYTDVGAYELVKGNPLVSVATSVHCSDISNTDVSMLDRFSPFFDKPIMYVKLMNGEPIG